MTKKYKALSSSNTDIVSEANSETQTEIGSDCQSYKSSDVAAKKTLLIEESLENGCAVDILKQFCISEYGLVDDEMRQRVWPLVLGVPSDEKWLEVNKEDMLSSSLYRDITIDVQRTLKRFPPGFNDEEKRDCQEVLSDLLYRLLKELTTANYYQGYHDVALTVLLVTDKKTTYSIMKKLTNGALSPHVMETMAMTSHLLNFIYALFKKRRPKLYKHLSRGQVGTTFCLPWVITWFSHDLEDYETIVRLFDYFMASPPMMPVYLAATIVLMKHTEVLQVPCDLADLHCFLKCIPFDTCFEDALVQCNELYKRYPPETLEALVEQFEKEQVEIQSNRSVSRNMGDKNRLKYIIFTSACVAAMAFGVAYYYKLHGPHSV